MSDPQRLSLDHITIGANSLEQGLAHVRDRLGVTVPAGGEHPRMGTHNCLMRIGEGLFLEIIAINPKAEPPPRARWFGLDDPEQQARLRARPRLICWVVRTLDIEGDLARHQELGQAVEMTRGDLTWQIGLKANGLLPEGGALPVLIQWPSGPHPSSRMTDLGLRLEQLRIRHPDPGRLTEKLRQLGADRLVQIGSGAEPHLEADIRLANGQVRRLD